MDSERFVYPIIPNNELPTSNPYGILSGILPWNWVNKKWDAPIQKNIDTFPKEYLPIGTKLYHGSLYDLDFLNLKKDRITFFGLDVVIALWYILEMQKSYTNFNWGKLYEFKVVKPIPIHILTNLYDNPKDNSVCNENICCIHPQIAFHGDTAADPPYDLSIEVTMNMKYFKDYIDLKKKYIVDPIILYNNRNKMFNEFNPIQSIVDLKFGRKKSKSKKSKKKFNFVKNRKT